MGNYIGKALLMDGGRLLGVSCQSSRDVFSEDAGFAYARWKFGGEGEPARADAFAAALRELGIDDGAPLALPPDMLVSRVLSLPATDSESLASMVRLEMEKFAPVADSELVVGFEAISATESETRVFAVAAPEAALDALAADLEASGLAVTRIDSSLLCEWRAIAEWTARRGEGSGDGGGGAEDGGGDVWVVALESGRFDFIASDERGPVFARTLGNVASPEDLGRETMLSLLDPACESGGFTPARFHLVAPASTDGGFADAVAKAAGGAPFERVPEDSLPPYVRCALEREDEDGCLDIVPPAWRDDEKAAQSRRNFLIGAGVAVAAWVALFAVLQAIPRIIERDTSAIRREIAALMPRYGEVSDLRGRVRLIETYADRSRSAIEVLRMLCERMPPDMVLTSFAYDNADDASGGRARKDPGGVKIAGDAASNESVLRFKDEIDGLGMFQGARLAGPNLDKNRNRFKFDLDWRFAEDAQWQ